MVVEGRLTLLVQTRAWPSTTPPLPAPRGRDSAYQGRRSARVALDCFLPLGAGLRALLRACAQRLSPCLRLPARVDAVTAVRLAPLRLRAFIRRFPSRHQRRLVVSSPGPVSSGISAHPSPGSVSSPSTRHPALSASATLLGSSPSPDRHSTHRPARSGPTFACDNALLPRSQQRLAPSPAAPRSSLLRALCVCVGHPL